MYVLNKIHVFQNTSSGLSLGFRTCENLPIEENYGRHSRKLFSGVMPFTLEN